MDPRFWYGFAAGVVTITILSLVLEWLTRVTFRIPKDFRTRRES